MRAELERREGVPAGEGAAVVTSVDVARHLGLSQTTVSRALRGDPAVTEATRDRVVAAAKQLGYVPNVAARMMITRRSLAVGVVVADLRGPIYPSILEALQQRLLDRGYRMVLIRDPDSLPDPESVDVFSNTLVDGIIMISARDGSTAVQKVVERGTPVVLLSRDDASANVDAVLADDQRAGELAVDHLNELGHESIGILTTHRDRSNGRQREDGARTRMRELGLPVREEWIAHLPISHDEGVRAASALLTLAEPPTALFCATDAFAFAVLDAATRLGLKVPEHLSVVGVDDSNLAGWSFINLTTVHQPVRDMAFAAVDRLIDRIEAAEPATFAHQVFPVALVVRGTTSATPHAVLRPPLRSNV